MMSGILVSTLCSHFNSIILQYVIIIQKIVVSVTSLSQGQRSVMWCGHMTDHVTLSL